MLVAVDPGVKVAGVAVYEDSELSSAWLAKGASWRETAAAVWRAFDKRYPVGVRPDVLAVEVPQVYHQSKLKGDPNDLIQLALMLGCLVGRGEITKVVEYLPRQWKGQVPKDIMIKRIQSKLSREERARVELPRAKSLQHNVWDAVGIGQYHERMRRRGHQSADSQTRATGARRKDSG